MAVSPQKAAGLCRGLQDVGGIYIYISILCFEWIAGVGITTRDGAVHNI